MRLGSHQIEVRLFDKSESILKKLKAVPAKERDEAVNQALLTLIQKEKEPCFLLAAVLDFIQKVGEAKLLDHYTLTSFEVWLNQFSNLNFEENYRIRAKIAGKWVERGDYQALFPIGMGKVYEGTHFVTAHKSPDLDTTVASFWGWLDAFAARVGSGLHIWNVPDGPPPSQVEIDWIFRDLFGPAVFTHLPKMRTTLNLTGKDLMTQQGMQKRTVNDSIADIDHDRDRMAVVIVDAQGHFLGDWRSSDVEGVRQVIISLSGCLRWFENRLHASLIHAFAKPKLHVDDLKEALQALLRLKLENCEPALEFSSSQKKAVDAFLQRILKVEEGLDADFETFAEALCKLGGVPFGATAGLIRKMKEAHLFDGKGFLVEDRPKMFLFLQKVVEALHLGVLKIRTRMEKLDIALQTKYEVFGRKPTLVTTRSDVEEIQARMGNYAHLTVVAPDHGRPIPMGVVHASNLRREVLGTVSLRDFCNREEMGIPNYLSVISVIDHHKSTLNTGAPSMAILSDAQSSNTLVALKAFEINDSNRRKPYYIHPEREYIEYLHFLYGIIDDTDLLSKVSPVDVQCVAELLNRMKKLAKLKSKIDISDMPRDRHFPKKAAGKILKDEDMYSLYSKVYQYREKEIGNNLSLCAKGEASNLFADTKVQNGCCRIGQTKLFASNWKQFEKHKEAIQKVWLHKATSVHKEKPEIELHIHMISTIVNAEEVYSGTAGKYDHLDELWLWIPEKESAVEKLKRFLNAFRESPGLKGGELSVTFLGMNGEELSLIFKESFLDIPHSTRQEKLPIAVLKFKAGSLNSRKAMVSPFLPSTL